MKRFKISALFLALTLLLCACTPQQGQTAPPSPDTSNQQQTDSTQSGQNSNTTDPSIPDPPDVSVISLDTLTLEVVVEWENADNLLSQLNALTELLQTALEDAGCTVDHLTITISTAGGFTAQAISEGGVDIAILPAADFVSCEDNAPAIAISSETPCETAIAVTRSNQALDDSFRAALLRTLLETDAGHNFLLSCRAGAVFIEPTEDALQLVRDYVAQLEGNEGGHEA